MMRWHLTIPAAILLAGRLIGLEERRRGSGYGPHQASPAMATISAAHPSTPAVMGKGNYGRTSTWVTLVSPELAHKPNPKIFCTFCSLLAGPVAANSPGVLTPPIPQWGPSVARAWAPVRHATR